TNFYGVYGGKAWGNFGLRAGYLISRSKISAERTASYGSFSDLNRADYHSDGRQGYVEGGYTFRMGERFEMEPYAQWARVEAKTDGFTETGGRSALQVARHKDQVDFTTGGLRFAADLSPGAGQTWLSLGGSLGYRHATGDIEPSLTAAWVGGGYFNAWGSPIAKNATLLNLNLAARLSPNTLLELGYDGQYASDARDHAVNARATWRF
ncbi:autotransporter outer membrane beta-barrel domain-containing protein, partial [Pseudoxanthomonas indica]